MSHADSLVELQLWLLPSGFSTLVLMKYANCLVRVAIYYIKCITHSDLTFHKIVTATAGYKTVARNHEFSQLRIYYFEALNKIQIPQ